VRQQQVLSSEREPKACGGASISSGIYRCPSGLGNGFLNKVQHCFSRSSLALRVRSNLSAAACKSAREDGSRPVKGGGGKGEGGSKGTKWD
jgi:hypothetical protein